MKTSLIFKLLGCIVFWLLPSIYMIVVEYKLAVVHKKKSVPLRLMLVIIGIVSVCLCLMYMWGRLKKAGLLPA